jgi:hypothetical protein
MALHTALRLVGAERRVTSDERMSAIARYGDLGESETARLAQAVKNYCESDVAMTVAAAQTLRHESPFALLIDDDAFLLIGSIDLYARTGAAAVIVDYKSGASGETGELVARYELQADCYALAALRDGCTEVTVEFVRPEVVMADGSLQRATFSYALSDAPVIEADLLARFVQMTESDFGPRPSWERCGQCDVPAPMCAERGRRAAALG